MNTLDRAYTNGYEDGRHALARALDSSLFPEDYPPGHELHDADHVYWNSGEGWQWLQDKERAESEGAVITDPPPAWEWDSGTIEMIAQEIKAAMPDE